MCFKEPLVYLLQEILPLLVGNASQELGAYTSFVEEPFDGDVVLCPLFELFCFREVFGLLTLGNVVEDEVTLISRASCADGEDLEGSP